MILPKLFYFIFFKNVIGNVQIRFRRNPPIAKCPSHPITLKSLKFLPISELHTDFPHIHRCTIGGVWAFNLSPCNILPIFAGIATFCYSIKRFHFFNSSINSILFFGEMSIEFLLFSIISIRSKDAAGEERIFFDFLIDSIFMILMFWLIKKPALIFKF